MGHRQPTEVYDIGCTGRDVGIAHCGQRTYAGDMTSTAPYIAETDARSRVVLPGRPRQMFVVRENPDGSLLLQPGKVITNAQSEYDETPELQELLAQAAASSTVTRRRR